MSTTVGVVIPAFRPDIAELRRYVTAIEETLAPETVVIELDSPSDGVAAELDDLPAVVETVPYRRGKGAAITAGFEYLETDVLVFADADGSTPADSLSAVVDPVTDGEADLSVGSRRHPESEVGSHQTFARRFLGDGFAWLAGTLLTVSLYDYQCGAKAITAAGWGQVRSHLYEPGFAWDVELAAIAGALDLRVAEVPIHWEDRPGSTVSPVRDSLALFRALLSARHRAKQLSDDRLHTAIAARREQPTALVERDR
ncbi:glycosyltransferase [Haloarcula salinisoli]|uniref:Glycosyltransferase n=1 Tax=Haloarcula salinisoli TaxID=2487746 RepID=A0A8J7YB82_9EURY|nr:glycosyltransferase [Halomicroarcula salinisoli]MBX0285661.1 glycosyltransferase [Halomicroarcula salinisoli]MBX0302850.1 glycosyltransferase [Halomicroarcula salinisoli]